MPRPINLEPTPTATGARASLPVARGATRRKTHTFTAGGPDLALANARTWLADGAAALAADRTLPEPRLYDRISTDAQAPDPGNTSPSSGRLALRVLVHNALHRRHEANRLAGPGRARQLRTKVDRLLVPWFDERAANGQELADDEVTAAMVEAFVQHLAGRDVAVPDDEDGWWVSEALLDVDVARYLCNQPRARLVVVAAENGVDLHDPAAKVSPAQLFDWGLLSARVHPHEYGHARRYAADLLRVLRWAVTDAVAAGRLPRDVTAGVRAVEADPAVRRRPPAILEGGMRRTLPLAEARDVFGHLHLVWLVVALIQRLCGPRISEVFGARVRGLVDRGEYGLLRILRQGGRVFEEREGLHSVDRRGPAPAATGLRPQGRDRRRRARRF